MPHRLLTALGGPEQFNTLSDKTIAAALPYMSADKTLIFLDEVLQDTTKVANVLEELFLQSPKTSAELILEDVQHETHFFEHRGKPALEVTGERLEGVVLPVFDQMEGTSLAKVLWHYYPMEKAVITNALSPSKVIDLLNSVTVAQGADLLKEISPDVALPALGAIDVTRCLQLLETVFIDEDAYACRLAAFQAPKRLVVMIARADGRMQWHDVVKEMLQEQRYAEFAELCSLLKNGQRNSLLAQFLMLIPQTSAKGLLPMFSNPVLAEFLDACFHGDIPDYPNLDAAIEALSGSRLSEVNPLLSDNLQIALFRAIDAAQKRRDFLSHIQKETAASILASCSDKEAALYLSQLSPKAAGDLLMLLSEKPKILRFLKSDELYPIFEYLRKNEKGLYQLVSGFSGSLDASSKRNLSQICRVLAALPTGVTHQKLRALRYQWLFESRLSLPPESWELLGNSVAVDTAQYAFFQEGSTPPPAVFQHFPRVTYTGGQSDRTLRLTVTANDGSEQNWPLSSPELIDIDVHDYRYCARRDPTFAKQIAVGSEFEEYIQYVEEQEVNIARNLVTLLPVLRPGLKDSTEQRDTKKSSSSLLGRPSVRREPHPPTNSIEHICEPIVELSKKMDAQSDYYPHLLRRTVAQLVHLQKHTELSVVLNRLSDLIDAIQRGNEEAEEDVQSLVIDILPYLFVVAKDADKIIETLDMAHRFIFGEKEQRIQIVRQLLLYGHHPYPIINLIRTFTPDIEQAQSLQMVVAYLGVQEDGGQALPSPVVWDILNAKETRLSVNLPDYWEYLALDESEREQQRDARGVELLNQVYEEIVEDRRLVERDVFLGSPQLRNSILKPWDDATMNAFFGKYHNFSYNSTVLLSILTILTNRRLLYIGPPGQGKTTTAEDLGQRILGLPLSLIQAATIWGHPDLTEEKMVARFDVGKLLSNGVEVIYPRLFVQIPFKIVDEINRIPATTLSVLYQLIDRGMVTYGNCHIPVPQGPLFATANKQDDGTWALPPPIVDRFDAAVIVPGINPQFITHLEKSVVRSLQNQDIQDDFELKNIAEIIAENRIYQRRCKMLERIRRDIDEKVAIEPEAAWRLQFFLSQLTYCKQLGETPPEKGVSPDPTQKKKSEGYFGDIYKLCEGCEYFQHREHNEICYHTMTMPSIRSYHALIAYAKALAWWRAPRPLTGDKIYAGVPEIKALLPFVLLHRLAPPDKLANDEQIELRRMQWIRELWEISMRKYNDIKEQIVSYHILLGDIQQALDEGQYARNQKRDVLKTRIAQMMNTLDSLETVAKYPMQMALMDACDKLGNSKGLTVR